MRIGFFWDGLERQLAECDGILNALGYPAGEYPTERTAAPYGEAWFAGQIGWRCASVLQTQKPDQQPNEMTLAHIMKIGALATDWQWRLSYRPAILTGAKQRRYLSELRDGHNRRAADKKAARRAFISASIEETKLTGGALDK